MFPNMPHEKKKKQKKQNLALAYVDQIWGWKQQLISLKKIWANIKSEGA